MRALLPSTAPSARPTGSTPATLLGIAALAAVAGTAHALGLGEISQQSGLGRPLRLVVPIIAAAGEEISGECFRLAPTQRTGDGIPEVLTARVTLETTASGSRLVVTTLRPLDDPVVKVTLQAGCAAAIRREYTLLLDPLPIETPVASQTAAVAAEPAPRPAAAAAPVTRAADQGIAAPAPPRPAAPRAPDRRRASPAPATGTSAAASAPGPAAVPAPRPARKAATPAPPPKLTVSTAIPSAAVPGKGTADATAREQEELANALEAETIVLRQRVLELTATVDRMQQEIVAAQALQAARLAAEDAATKASPQATISRWWGDGWPILAMAIGLALLLAAVLLALRRRRGATDTPVWMPPVVPDDAPAPVRPATRPAPATSGVARAAAQATAARQGPDTRGGQAAAVAVSELSHVTEEAGVYLAFNRVDRAIEVLQQHIRSAAGSLPAAWLMLLDLYRKQGRDQDFRELAQDFHLRFNAAVPAWDNFAAHDEADPGLEAFPHIIRQLLSSWGTAECRGLLDRLLHDNRDGRRTGFSLPAYEDILFLRQLDEQLSVDAGAAQRAPRPRTAAGAAAAAPPAAANKLPKALDLELELDRDMLDSAKAPRPGSAPPKPGKA